METKIKKIEEEKDFEKIHFFSKKLKTIEDSLDLEKKLIESFIYEIQIAEDEKNKASQTLFESSIYYMLLTIFVSIIFIVIFLFVYKYYVKNKNLLKRKEKEQNDLKKSMLDITIENQKNQKIINEIHVDISKINKSTSEYNKNSVFKELHLKVNQHISSQEENEILKKQLDQIKSDFL